VNCQLTMFPPQRGMRNTIRNQSAQPEKQAAHSSSISTPVTASGQHTFLVIVMDEAAGTGSDRVVKAADDEAAAREAVQRSKADHDLGDLDDEAAGFKAIAVYSQEDLVRILKVMELPEPDL
jgi:hypothetical protein